MNSLVIDFFIFFSVIFNNYSYLGNFYFYISIITFDIPTLLYGLFPFFKQVWQIVFCRLLYEKKSGTLIWMPDRLLLFDAHLYGFQVTGL